jgi:broad specificity phosphatase PhoE
LLNEQECVRGRLNPPLDKLGHTQATALAAQLAYLHPVVVVSSPLLRARQTAEAIASRAQTELIFDDRLADRDYGRWTGRPVAEVVGQWGSLDAAADVESAEELRARVLAALDTYSARLAEGAVILVAHDTVNTALLSALDPALGAPTDIPQELGCWNLLVQGDDSRWTVAQISQTPEEPAEPEE